MAHAKLVPELLCSNLEASLAFYLDLTGFVILYDRPEDRFAYLGLAGAEIMLEEAPEESADKRVWWTAAAKKPYGRSINLQIEVTAVETIHERLEHAGWPLFRPMEERWYRKHERAVGNRQFLVQDPDGYLLRFFSDLGERPADGV